MPNKVIITKISAMEALSLKADLDQSGLQMNQDYTWRFQPVKYSSDLSWEPTQESQVLFEFVEPAMASFYKIKWIK